MYPKLSICDTKPLKSQLRCDLAHRLDVGVQIDRDVVLTYT